MRIRSVLDDLQASGLEEGGVYMETKPIISQQFNHRGRIVSVFSIERTLAIYDIDNGATEFKSQPFGICQ